MTETFQVVKARDRPNLPLVENVYSDGTTLSPHPIKYPEAAKTMTRKEYRAFYRRTRLFERRGFGKRQEYKDTTTRLGGQLKYPELAATMTKEEYKKFVARERYFANREENLKKMRIYRQKRWANPEYVNRWHASGKRYRDGLKADVISHYSNGTNKCACCSISGLMFLTLDHIAGGGNEHRRNLKQSQRLGAGFYRWLQKNGYPTGYQVLCWNCNAAKHINGGICPHQTARMGAVILP